MKKAGLGWLASGENEEYIAPEFIQLLPSEVEPMKRAATELYQLMLRAADEVVSQNRWSEVGIPSKAIELVKYSLRNEKDLHLISRFDFAGGLDALPLKMLELNADTCSLLPETHFIQNKHAEQERRKLPSTQPFNQLEASLMRKFQQYLKRHPDKDSILLTTYGHTEDWLNTGVITAAAKKCGFQEAQEMTLGAIIFSPEDGFFIELHEEEYRRFDTLFKFIPWDLLIEDEPDVFDAIQRIILSGKGIVMNPAFTMLLQSKGLMKIMYEMEPYNPYLLKTDLTDRVFRDNRYVRKPMFGRMGENISFYNGFSSPDYETEGDYGQSPSLYQELALFNMDREDHRYQPSIFYTGEPSALCFRRQDDPVIDDDAEFVGHVVE